MKIPPHFQIQNSLGVGATSEVFSAFNETLQKRVALKVFSQQVLTDPDSTMRLQSEVDVLETLQHPNIVGLYGSHRADRFFAIELEFVDGLDLKAWQKMDVERAGATRILEPRLWILAQVARGLGAAHEKGILHRDLKPENILVSRSGEVKITDFGLARSISRMTMTRVGMLVGSLGFMAPEVIDGQRATVQSDLFSLGALAYELIAGQSPFSAAESPQALIRNISTGKFAPLRQFCPYVHPKMAKLIESCLSPDPTHRPESVWLLEAQLMTFLNQTGLLSYCQPLVATDLFFERLPLALKQKHGSLQLEINALLTQLRESKTPAEISPRILPLCSEMSSLFPQDPTPAEVMRVLQSAQASANATMEKKRFILPLRWRDRRLQAVFALLVMGLFAVGMYSVRQRFSVASQGLLALPAQVPTRVAPQVVPSMQETAPMREATTVASATPPPIADVSVVRPEAPKTKPAVAKPKSKPAEASKTQNEVAMGKVRFEVDDDVDVFLNDQLVPRDRFNKVEVEEGKHTVRLVKQGFMPIDNTIVVSSRKETVIRARGGAK